MKAIQTSKGYTAYCDDSDYQLLSRHTWHAKVYTNTVYPGTHIDGRVVQMHKLLMACPKGMQIDHKDRNGLNNCRDNLRIATRSQNGANRAKSKTAKVSTYKGVYKSGAKWFAKIACNNKEHYLGTFANEIEAARAYDKAALEMFGEFAAINGV